MCEPQEECTECDGNGCGTCRYTGWIPVAQEENDAI